MWIYFLAIFMLRFFYVSSSPQFETNIQPSSSMTSSFIQLSLRFRLVVSDRPELVHTMESTRLLPSPISSLLSTPPLWWTRLFATRRTTQWRCDLFVSSFRYDSAPSFAFCNCWDLVSFRYSCSFIVIPWAILFLPLCRLSRRHTMPTKCRKHIDSI